MSKQAKLHIDFFADLQIASKSNPTAIGLGHARRILILAESLQQNNSQTTELRCFFDEPNHARRLFPHTQLPFLHWYDTSSKHTPRDLLVVDSYRLTELPAPIRNSYRHIACFHDDKSAPSYATIAICPNVSAPPPSTDTRGVHHLTGAMYFPFDLSLTDEALSPRAQARDAFRVMLWLGGDEDGSNVAPLLNVLLSSPVLSNFVFEVILSPLLTCDRDISSDLRLHLSSPQVRLHRDITAMSRLFSFCGTYVGGAGVSSCEAALLGLRLVLCALADNQRGNANSLARAGAILFDISHPQSLLLAFFSLLEESQDRQPLNSTALASTALASTERASKAVRELGFDRHGASRLASALLRIIT